MCQQRSSCADPLDAEADLAQDGTEPADADDHGESFLLDGISRADGWQPVDQSADDPSTQPDALDAPTLVGDAVDVAPFDAPSAADREPDLPVTLDGDGPLPVDASPIDAGPGEDRDALDGADVYAVDGATDTSLVCGSITVTALIDGLDKLHIVADGIYWEHLLYAGPGLHSYQNLPTTIATGAGSDVSWCPVWDNGCNTCDGSCGELYTMGTSDLFPMKVFPASMVGITFTCTGRDSCTLLQSPTALHLEAIVGMDDTAADGSSTYSATLSFRCRPHD